MKRYLILLLFLLNVSICFHIGKIEMVAGVQLKAQIFGGENTPICNICGLYNCDGVHNGIITCSVCGKNFDFCSGHDYEKHCNTCGEQGHAPSDHCQYCTKVFCFGMCQTCSCCNTPYCPGLHCVKADPDSKPDPDPDPTPPENNVDCPSATMKITDGKNSNRVASGGTLVMVASSGEPRSALFEATPLENYIPKQGYPKWNGDGGVSGNGFASTGTFSNSGNVGIVMNQGCSEITGRVEIVDENERSLSAELNAWPSKIASITSALNSLIDSGNGEKFELSLNATGDLKIKNVDKYMDGTTTGICVSGSAGLTGAIKIPQITTNPHYIYGIVYVKGELSPFEINGGFNIGGKYDESQSNSIGLNGSLNFGSQISGSIIVAAGIDDVCSVGGIGTASTQFEMKGILTYGDKKLVLSSEASMSSIRLEGSIFIKIGDLKCQGFQISKDIGSQKDVIFEPIELLNN